MMNAKIATTFCSHYISRLERLCRIHESCALEEFLHTPTTISSWTRMTCRLQQSLAPLEYLMVIHQDAIPEFTLPNMSELSGCKLHLDGACAALNDRIAKPVDALYNSLYEVSQATDDLAIWKQQLIQSLVVSSSHSCHLTDDSVGRYYQTKASCDAAIQKAAKLLKADLNQLDDLELFIKTRELNQLCFWMAVVQPEVWIPTTYKKILELNSQAASLAADTVPRQHIEKQVALVRDNNPTLYFDSLCPYAATSFCLGIA